MFNVNNGKDDTVNWIKVSAFTLDIRLKNVS